jgi:predicted transcriptional regulator
MEPSLGTQELKVLRFVADYAPVSVKAVHESLGVSEGLAKTTVQTMMERLRRKGFLRREKPKGSSQYEYSPAVAKSDLMRGLVRDFVEQTLGGAFSPLVAYLAERRNLTREEMVVLERLVQETEAQENNSTPEIKDSEGDKAGDSRGG